MWHLGNRPILSAGEYHRPGIDCLIKSGHKRKNSLKIKTLIWAALKKTIYRP